MEGKAGERERKYEPQSFIIFMYSAFISNIFTASHNQTSKYWFYEFGGAKNFQYSNTPPTHPLLTFCFYNEIVFFLQATWKFSAQSLTFKFVFFLSRCYLNKRYLWRIAWSGTLLPVWSTQWSLKILHCNVVSQSGVS